MIARQNNNSSLLISRNVIFLFFFVSTTAAESIWSTIVERMLNFEQVSLRFFYFFLFSFWELWRFSPSRNVISPACSSQSKSISLQRRKSTLNVRCISHFVYEANSASGLKATFRSRERARNGNISTTMELGNHGILRLGTIEKKENTSLYRYIDVFWSIVRIRRYYSFGVELWLFLIDICIGGTSDKILLMEYYRC